MSFDALPRRFSITIDGMPVAMPKANPQERPQAEAAKPENGDQPAIFEIQDSHLVCGPLVMGRSFIEDRSLMPKRVIWSTREDMHQIQPVQVEQTDNGPQLRLQGGKLAYMDGRLFSPILDEFNQRVEIRPEYQ